MNRKSVQKRKTHLEMLDSSSDSDVEILDDIPGAKRKRKAEPIPLLEDLANGNFEAGDEPIPEPIPEQNVEREHESLLVTPEGSSSSDNEMIEIDDSSEDAVFHEENPNVDESAIVIYDSESEPPSPRELSSSSDEVIVKETFRPRISSENENQLILNDDKSCGVERTPIRVVMDLEAAVAVLAENSNLTPTEISIKYRDPYALYRILLLNKEYTPGVTDEEQQEIDEERAQLNFGSMPDQLRQIQGSFAFSYISTQIELHLAKSRKNGIDDFPEEAFICCTCTDGCVTINCECKRATWDDNRDYLDLKSKTLKHSKPPKNLTDFPYRDGKLLDSIQPESNSRKAYIGTNIPYECNRKCACQNRENKRRNPCTNHVVQDGLKVRIEMFLTKKKGWGVRALEDIPDGTFMGAYIGEIRQSEINPGQDKGHLKERKLNRKYKRYVLQIEPIEDIQKKSMNWALENGDDKRPNLDKIALMTNQTPRDIHRIMSDGGFEPDLLPFHWHPQNSIEYEYKSKAEQTQIDKDFAYITNSYVYDSANHGSICRLFNHRCDDEKGPMLKWQYVHTLMQDQRMPTIAFFAQRDIKKGEEITWDYRLQTADKKVAERHLCHCESPKCRKYFIEYAPS